jgi:hypothetical protein
MGDLAISNLTNNNEEIVEKEVKEIIEVTPKKNEEIDTKVKDLCGLIFLYITIQDSGKRLDCNATRFDAWKQLALLSISIYGMYIIHFRK